MSQDVEGWIKRLRRKAPFYVLSKSDYVDRHAPERTGTSYRVIWNDGPKTKIGVLHDWMMCRYGIVTQSVLNGERLQDLWNGSGVSDEDFQQMLLVRKGRTRLPTVELKDLKNIRW